jgi:hypothetical protein
MTDDENDLLWGGLAEVAEQTKEQLAPDQSACFVNLYNDWLDIRGSILDAYPHTDLLNSLVVADLLSLGKELHWMHRLFHWGNYPLIYRNVRYAWELMALAYFADVDEIKAPDTITDRPGNSLDDKAAWLERHGMKINWRTVISRIRDKVIDRAELEHFGKIWGDLNRCVHASRSLRDRMLNESALLVKDAFDQNWGVDTCRAASDVFDLIWLIVLRRFPNCIPVLATSSSFRNTLRTRRIVFGG